MALDLQTASRNLFNELRKQSNLFNYNTTVNNPIVIGLSENNADAIKLIPSEYEGYKVIYKIIGTISAATK